MSKDNPFTLPGNPLSSIAMDLAKGNNPAKWMHERLGEYIYKFEKELDNEHEVGARLVSFGSEILFHIIKVGYWGPDIITFDGINKNGDKLKLIQNISQLSVLLVAMKKLEEKPRRIGFIKEDDKHTENK